MSINEDVHVVAPSGDSDRYLKKAKASALELHNATQTNQLTVDDLYIVWFVKGLQNWKALIATNVPGDNLYFEVTHNGDRQETYVDGYTKTHNYVIADIPAH